MNFLFTNLKSDRIVERAEAIWGNRPIEIEVNESTRLFLQEKDNHSFYEDAGKVAAFQGYVRDFELSDTSSPIAHNMSFLRTIETKWPIPDSMTGSFAVVMIDKEKNSLIMANDVIGFHPIYYTLNKDTFVVSSSLILIGILAGNSLDEIGILQRLCSVDMCNSGSRTVLQNCSRLLPGELLGFDLDTLELKRREYDNSLYGNVGPFKTQHMGGLVDEYWSKVKREFRYAISDWRTINVALSGGMDSRLALCAIPAGKEIRCFTFGDESFYETKVARRLARLKNATFQSFHDYSLLFPPYDVLKKYVSQTEALSISAWLQILENVPLEHEKTPILIGDSCESLVGRNVKAFSSREKRMKSYIETVILGKGYHFTESSTKSFREWKDRITRHELNRFDNKLLIHFSVERSRLEQAVVADLEQLFSRIESHSLPYTELYDELYQWYTHARFPISKQILLCQTKFIPFSPTMSTSLLRATSNIHPNLRLNYRFFHELFTKTEELKGFARVPTSDVVFVPQTWPPFLKFLVWGLRSKIDQMLIKRMMKRANPSLRYRLVDSQNWPVAYQTASAAENVSKWFEYDHIGSKQKMQETYMGRKKLSLWPFENIDMISTAEVNTELRLITENR